MAHTQGNWQAEYDDNGFYFISAEGMPSPYIMATGSESDTDKANITLAAASPDLLKALQELVEKCLRSDAYNQKVDELYNAQQAIQKAKPSK